MYSLALLLETRQTAAVINGLRGTFPYAQLTSAVVNKKKNASRANLPAAEYSEASETYRLLAC